MLMVALFRHTCGSIAKYYPAAVLSHYHRSRYPISYNRQQVGAAGSVMALPEPGAGGVFLFGTVLPAGEKPGNSTGQIDENQYE